MKKFFVIGVICLLCTISVFSQSKKEWERVQSSNSWNVYKQFILVYPNGKYTELAKQKLAQLKEPEKKIAEITEEQPIKNIDGEKKTKKSANLINETKNTVNSVQSEISTIKKEGGKYTLDQNPISRKQLLSLYITCPDALTEYKLGKTNSTNSSVMILGGLAYIIVSKRLIIMKREDELTKWFREVQKGDTQNTFDYSEYDSKIKMHTIIGAGITVIGGILKFTAPAHFTKAVNLYNSKHNGISSTQIKFDFNLNSDGIGFTVKF